MSLNKLISDLQKQKSMKQRQKKLKKIATIATSGVAAGIVGAVGGLLLAPKSGKELRQDIAKTAGELGDNVKNNIDEKKEKLSSNVIKTKQVINEYLASKKSKGNASPQEAEVAEVLEDQTTKEE
jgi:gas vesicle protein